MNKLVFMASFLIPMVSMAQQIRVEKIKGNKAVIEFSGNLVPGKTYSLGTASAPHSATDGNRHYVVGGSADLQFLSSSASTFGGVSTTNNLIRIMGRFGWNMETYEFGPIAGYNNTVIADTSNSAFKFGAFGDYNLTPNRPSETSIYGGAGEFSYSSISNVISGSEMDFFVSGFAKWFVLGPSTTLRIDAGYVYDKVSYSNYSITTQGFALRGGIATYF